MSMRFVSLDTSTKISGCTLWIDGELSEYKLIDLSKNKDGEQRLNEMILELLKLLNKWKPDSVWIEHPQGQGANVLIVNKLSEIIGAVRAFTLTKNIEFNEINPSEWRALVGLKQGKKKRSELKQMSIDMVKDLFGIECNDDQADSILIGQAAMNYFNGITE